MTNMRAAEKALDLHITIAGTEPEIWRDVRVPAAITLTDLHKVIQRAFGWDNRHLHMFESSNAAGQERRFASNEETIMELETEPAAVFTLEDVFTSRGTTLVYEYDFGDTWQHEISISGHAVAPAGQLSCLAGANRGPVEDSGGTGGYRELCGILLDPSHERHDDLATWYSWVTNKPAAEFDPQEFDLEKCNRSLARLSPQLGDATPTPEEMATVVLPAKWLLQRVGADGLELTKDDYLKPAVVADAMTTLGWEKRWYGKFNRESQTLPVFELRSTLQDWGLLRKFKGKLVRTPAGRKTYDDDVRLWGYLADRFAHPRDSGEAEVRRRLVDWLLEDRVPPHNMLGQAVADSLMSAGFRAADGAGITDAQGMYLFIEARRTLATLGVFEEEDFLDSPPLASEAGLKFLLEVQRRQNEQHED
ncbi:plasmid pRiA4b ORF-3 family protein [Arthrobacter crystallopoietes]|uniref:plasmid pRiA4b ORF-3 family protein n=1 Tax=Crystallibacter crystallopoietes TaxID=37928 RepID=UPI001ABE8B94|nr:plasmid pRiA4b ORF-3 family protein [Arthrobacter crystallopoietes]QTG82428.1 plasmid pRiA4b ORF-3 family protein [Arthrobacter crystallopoietes]